jgi:glycosyltransferase involved in cell wall biosynthesis
VTHPVVEVLMSTYDGERFLRPQVDSVLAQTGVDVRLRVRDDGSRDATLAVLEEYAADRRVSVTRGANLGVPAAFFRLVDESSDDVDLWALCDQDDVWVPTKLSRAAAALADVPGPALYCARVLVTDEDLRPLYPHELPRRGPSFANALVQNIALGCTVVLNWDAREVLRSRWPRECVMHDAWMYLVVAGVGSVVYDQALVVHYRQHRWNTVGVGRGPVSRFAGRVRRQLSPDGHGKHGRQDRELLRLHGERLRPEARRELEDLLRTQESAVARLHYALGGPAHRQTLGSNVVLKVLQVLNRV